MDRKPERETGPEPEHEPDFAEEHKSATFADQLEGGPEGRPESESPKGYAGMEARRLSRRRRRQRR